MRKSKKVGVPVSEYARVELVCSPEQKDRWEGAARREGLSLSAWLSLAADRAATEQGAETADGSPEW